VARAGARDRGGETLPQTPTRLRIERSASLDEAEGSDRDRLPRLTRGLGGAGRRRHGGRGLELRLLAEDGAFEPLQAGARLDPELVDEQRSRLLVGGERFGLAPRPVEGKHGLAAQALPVGMRGDERLELADEVGPVPRPQVGVDPPLEGDQAQLLEPGDLRLGELLVGEVGERAPVPEAERLAERRRGERILPARSQRLCLPHQAFEPVQVELVGADLEQVARRPRADPLGAERPAQAEDVHLHGLPRARRRVSSPELVD
jgi:hypothetical protein